MNVRHGRRALLAATLIVMASGCGPRDRLDVDERYSEQLSIGSAEYARVARSNAAATVEVVQVYAPGGSDGISLREATEGRLLYESRVPAEIESLFEALQIRQVREVRADGALQTAKTPATSPAAEIARSYGA